MNESIRELDGRIERAIEIAEENVRQRLQSEYGDKSWVSEEFLERLQRGCTLGMLRGMLTSVLRFHTDDSAREMFIDLLHNSGRVDVDHNVGQ